VSLLFHQVVRGEMLQRAMMAMFDHENPPEFAYPSRTDRARRNNPVDMSLSGPNS